jgi:DNA-binding NtrC family response regulator
VAVLLDMTMPKVSSPQAFAEIRRIRRDVPVFLCSGYSAEDATGHFRGGDLAGFIQKPFVLDTLLDKLRGVLET